MQTAESTHQKLQINKTSVLWGKEELLPLWESLSVPVACELLIFSGIFCCPWFTFCSFLVSCTSFPRDQRSVYASAQLWINESFYLMLVRLQLGVFMPVCWMGTPVDRSQLGRCVSVLTPNQPFCPQKELSHWPPLLWPEGTKTPSPCDNHIPSLIPELVWIKLYPMSQKCTTVNFNLTQVTVSLLVTAVPVCLSAMTEPHSLPALQFPSHLFGSSPLLFVYKMPSLDFACVENLAESCHPFDLIFSRSPIFLPSCL